MTSLLYIPNFVPTPNIALSRLIDELPFERRGSTPRFEYFSSDIGLPYSYGKGAGLREYLAKPWHPIMLDIRMALEDRLTTKLEVCFVNYYKDEKDHLGWHADDSSVMDDSRPIVSVSLGAVRQLWVRPNDYKSRDDFTPDKYTLENGSALVMPAGMQDTHQHRIPKAGHICGPRISLVYRGYVNS